SSRLMRYVTTVLTCTLHPTRHRFNYHVPHGQMWFGHRDQSVWRCGACIEYSSGRVRLYSSALGRRRLPLLHLLHLPAHLLKPSLTEQSLGLREHLALFLFHVSLDVSPQLAQLVRKVFGGWIYLCQKLIYFAVLAVRLLDEVAGLIEVLQSRVEDSFLQLRVELERIPELIEQFAF